MKALVIVIDGLQLAYLGCYGNDWVPTPALDRLAAEGVVFDHHYSDCPEAPAARRAWRNGCYQFPDIGNSLDRTVAGSDLVHSLNARGITTRLVMEASHPSAEVFQAGWEDIFTVQTVGADSSSLERTLDAAKEALDRLAGRQDWLLWLEFATLLPPWKLPQEFLLQPDPASDNEDSADEPLTPLLDPKPGALSLEDPETLPRLRLGYASAVSYVDAGIAELLEDLESRALLDDIPVIVTTDRGQALGEHGVVGDDQPSLHEELLHLPLLIRIPQGADSGRRISALTQPVDLMPTLIEAFGCPPTAVTGRSLWPLIRGEPVATREFICAGLKLKEHGEWAIRTPEWSLILPGEAALERASRLYRKPDDRWEVNNLRQHHYDLAENLERTLRDFVATAGVSPIGGPPP